MTAEALAQTFLSSQPHSEYQRTIGYRATAVAPGRAELMLELRQHHLNRTDRVHGGVLMCLLDSVGGYAGVIVVGEQAPRQAVTLSLSTNFVRAARVGTLTARGRVTGGGRQIFFSHMEVFDVDDNCIATGEGSYRYL